MRTRASNLKNHPRKEAVPHGSSMFPRILQILLPPLPAPPALLPPRKNQIQRRQIQRKAIPTLLQNARPIFPRCEFDVELGDDARDDGAELHQGKLLADAGIGAWMKGREIY